MGISQDIAARVTGAGGAERRGGPEMFHALYYPYFNVRDERWLKIAALYWPRIVRLVPEGFRGAETPAMRTLANELGFIERHSPGASVDSIAPLMTQLIAEHGPALVDAYRPRVERPGPYSDPPRTSGGYGHDPGSEQQLATLHKGQIHPAVISALVESGLALDWDTATRALADLLDRLGGLLTLEQRQKARSLLHSGYGGSRPDQHQPLDERDWLVMDATLVAAYTSLLAEDYANANRLSLTTDRPDMYALTNNLSSQGLAAALLGHPVPAEHGARPQLAETLAFMTLELVVPADVDSVPISKIVQVRRRYADEFLAFGQAIEQAAKDLAELADIRDAAILERYLRDEVEQRFLQPAEQLRKQLRSLRLDAATATVNVKTELPAALGLVGGAQLSGHPLIAGTLAAGLSMLTVARSALRQRAQAKDANPAPSYLLNTAAQLRSPNRPSATLVRTRPAATSESSH